MRYILLFLFIQFSIASCSTQDPVKRQNTQADNVQVIDSVFIIQSLNRERQIRVYLPPNYEDSDEMYPVLYMHDGQNLFNDQTSYVGEWHVDETLNELSDRNNLKLIVVGIDNGLDKRMNEMGPWDNEKFGVGEGAEYVNFIVNQVKPYVDKNYRTLSDRSNTALMGSSMGGLITHYGLLKYADVFGKAGIFSPSYWYSPEIFNFTKSNPFKKDVRICMIIGKKEGRMMVDPANEMIDLIREIGHPEENLSFAIVSKGTHGETFWGQQFGPAIEWLFNSNQ